jgi:hypothetical protein
MQLENELLEGQRSPATPGHGIDIKAIGRPTVGHPTSFLAGVGSDEAVVTGDRPLGAVDFPFAPSKRVRQRRIIQRTDAGQVETGQVIKADTLVRGPLAHRRTSHSRQIPIFARRRGLLTQVLAASELACVN